MRIEGHAIDNYTERVLNMSDEQVTDSIISFAQEQILLAVLDPDIIYHNEKKGCPVHIRNGCAVPVKDNGETYVPSTYSAGTFLKKMKRRDKDARAVQA